MIVALPGHIHSILQQNLVNLKFLGFLIFNFDLLICSLNYREVDIIFITPPPPQKKKKKKKILSVGLIIKHYMFWVCKRLTSQTVI